MSGQLEATLVTKCNIFSFTFEFTSWRSSLGEDVSSFPLIVFEDKLSDLTDS